MYIHKNYMPEFYATLSLSLQVARTLWQCATYVIQPAFMSTVQQMLWLLRIFVNNLTDMCMPSIHHQSLCLKVNLKLLCWSFDFQTVFDRTMYFHEELAKGLMDFISLQTEIAVLCSQVDLVRVCFM